MFRTKESTFEDLIRWADSNYSRSFGLASKPHVVLVFNKCESSLPEDAWGLEAATDDIYADLTSTLHSNETFKMYVKKWEKSHVYIGNCRDPMERYYSSFTLIRLPGKKAFGRLDVQRNRLNTRIRNCCEDSYDVKRRLNMLFSADGLALHMSLAFDHFSKTLEEPCGYKKALMSFNPPPTTLFQSMFDFIKLVAAREDLTEKIQILFTSVRDIIASFLMLDAARKRRHGDYISS